MRRRGHHHLSECCNLCATQAASQMLYAYTLVHMCVVHSAYIHVCVCMHAAYMQSFSDMLSGKSLPASQIVFNVVSEWSQARTRTPPSTVRLHTVACLDDEHEGTW